MSSQTVPYISVQQYLEQEERAERPSEYFRGEVFPMEEVSLRHAGILISFARALPDPTSRNCQIFGGGRLYIAAIGFFTYPDLLVVCGALEYSDSRKTTLTNPKLIIEILSPSRRDYDRGEKFLQYRTIPSLLEYIAVAQDSAHIEHSVRQPGDHWLLTDIKGLDKTLRIDSLDCGISTSDVYRNIEFD